MDAVVKTKICNACGMAKPLESFSPDRTGKDGRATLCKLCRNEKNRLNPEPIRARSRKYREKNLEKIKEAARKKNASGEGLFYHNKSRAKERGVLCLWTKEEFLDWFANQGKICFYCGEEVTFGRELNGFTLDRLDNAKGYELGNVVVACLRCNTMKGSWLTSEQMLDATQRYFKQGTMDSLGVDDADSS